tara:strand:+ start:767 stop:1087 length:321 start_codon:yes stop_codon:yes gene_type:complete
MSLWELEIQVNELVNKYLEESDAVEVSAKDVGLDVRCGRVYVSLEEYFIAVKGSTGSIEYYGGFEYVDAEYKTTIGCVTFYEEADRVRSCLEYYKENLKENSEGDE